MKSSIIGMLAFVTTFSSGVALGCPVALDDDAPIRRPIVQPVSIQVSQLFERAAQLDAAATSRDAQASVLDRSADTLATRARILRQQAASAGPGERSELMAIAEEIALRALADRQLASRDRAQAADLRVQARALRDRANQLVLVGNGGGWRRHVNDRPVPARAETAI